MKRMLTAGLAMSVLATGVFAQTPPRKPGPEHARLGNFAGTWTLDGESEGLKYRMTQTCEWFDGGYHLVCRAEGTGADPMGAMKSHVIIGYDPREKTYTRYSHNNFGNGAFMKGSVSGQTWTWTGEVAVFGALMKLRNTMTEQSPTSIAYKAEGSMDGKAWEVFEEGRSTKVP